MCTTHEVITTIVLLLSPNSQAVARRKSRDTQAPQPR